MKKKNKKLPQIGVLAYLTLDELFEYIFIYMTENIEREMMTTRSLLNICGDLVRTECGSWKMHISS